eukprot:1161551-Pelagomonas_calceolata.AAC.12
MHNPVSALRLSTASITPAFVNSRQVYWPARAHTPAQCKQVSTHLDSSLEERQQAPGKCFGLHVKSPKPR